MRDHIDESKNDATITENAHADKSTKRARAVWKIEPDFAAKYDPLFV